MKTNFFKIVAFCFVIFFISVFWLGLKIDNNYNTKNLTGSSISSFKLISLNNNNLISREDFKQNKFTPASHIPIVAPSKIHSYDIEAVIVMAASYSNEVVKILRKDYKYNFSIAVFKENNLVILR